MRKVRREHDFVETEYIRALKEHEEWIDGMDGNTRCWYESRYMETIDGSRLDPPDKDKFFYDHGPLPDLLFDRWQASEFLRRFPHYLWDD